jgi:hypothetical protein
MILQPGAAGNGLLAPDGSAPGTQHCIPNGAADGQGGASHSNGNSLRLPNGALLLPQDTMCSGAWPGSSSQPQQQQQQWQAGSQVDAVTAAAYAKHQQQDNMQQQIPVQVQLGAQMAQLHAQHNCSRSQPLSTQAPPTSAEQLPSLGKLQQAYATQAQQTERDQQQQQQQLQQQQWYAQQQQAQQQYLVQPQSQSQQQQQQQIKQQGVPAVSALRQSLFAMQQQQQAMQQEQHAPGQLQEQQQQQQQQLQQMTMQQQQQQNAAMAGAVAAAAEAQLQAQAAAQQHSTARLTVFVPAAQADNSGEVPQLVPLQQPQQHNQEQQQQQQQGSKAAPDGPPSSNLTARLSIQLKATYKKCSETGVAAAAAGGAGAVTPRRILTRPAAGVRNNGWDNEACDLILSTQVCLWGVWLQGRGCRMWFVAEGGVTLSGVTCMHSFGECIVSRAFVSSWCRWRVPDTRLVTTCITG